MKGGNLKPIIRMSGKAKEVFALFRVFAKHHGAKTLGEMAKIVEEAKHGS